MKNSSLLKKVISIEINDQTRQVIVRFDDQTIETFTINKIEYEQLLSDDWLLLENIGDINIYDYIQHKEFVNIVGEEVELTDEKLLSEDKFACAIYPDINNSSLFYNVKLITNR